jgi:hypothetical protein
MRRLSETFMDALRQGFLASITRKVNNDPDLNLEIRDNYINVYYKGNSLLKLSEVNPRRYAVKIHRRFLKGLDMPAALTDRDDAAKFVDSVPALKQNVVEHGHGSLEIEYEQMIIRANNFEPRNNSEYFIIDRQYTVSDGQFDLTGIFWNSARRRRGQEAALCFIEVKFALNQDISEVHRQLARYYAAIKPRADSITVIANLKSAIVVSKVVASQRVGEMPHGYHVCDQRVRHLG